MLKPLGGLTNIKPVGFASSMHGSFVFAQLRKVSVQHIKDGVRISTIYEYLRCNNKILIEYCE